MMSMKIRASLFGFFLVVLTFMSTFLSAQANSDGKPEVGMSPYFASLKTKPANVRVGPGKIYPIEWVLMKTGLPILVLAKYEHWRKIRDADGTEGWIYFRMLSNKRTAVTTEKNVPLLKEPSLASEVVAQMDSGVIGKIVKCEKDWCYFKHSDVKGWVAKKSVWGV